MASQVRFPAGIFVDGPITTGDVTVNPGWKRENMIQESLAIHPIPWGAWRRHDAYESLLTGVAGADDLGLIGGTFGTGVPSIQTSDAKATTVTQYARAMIVMPIEYEAATDVVIRTHAGMKTNPSDTTATIDCELYLSDKEGLVNGTDKIATAATTINSTTLADQSFVVTAGALSPGDILDLRITIAITDGATGTAVIGWLGAIYLLCDVRG